MGSEDADDHTTLQEPTVYDHWGEDLERENRESKAAWDAVRRELIGKEFYDSRTARSYTITAVEAIQGRHRIGRTYLVRDNEGRLCEVVPVTSNMSNGIPYTILDSDAIKTADRG